MVVIRKILLTIYLFLLILPIAYSLTITQISPKNNSVVSESSTTLSVSTNDYTSCNYSLDSSPFTKFSSSDASYWKVGTSTKKLELSEELTSGTNRETLRNITTYIDKNNLEALASGSVTNNKATSPYNQYLYILGLGVGTTLDTGYVRYAEDAEDVTADFLYFKSGKEIGRYLLIFEPTAFESNIEDSSGVPSSTGLYLPDFEDVNIKLFRKSYKIVQTRRLNTSGNNLKLILIENAIKDTLLEKQTKIYKINNTEYQVTLNFVDSDEAQFIINGQSTVKLKEDEFSRASGIVAGVKKILYQDYAGGIHTATFYLGTQEIELKDSNILDVDSTHALKVDGNTIDDAYVIIEGSDNGSIFKINRIHVNMTADDDFYVPAGGRLSEEIKQEGGTTAEPQVLFTQNWDIAYKGLKNESTEKIKLKTSGSSQYNLQFVDGNGNTVEVPIAKSPSGSNLLFGGVDRDFINVEAWNISKDDYLVVTNGTATRSLRPTYILQYKGADKLTADGHVLKFKNLGDGSTIELNYSNSTPLAYLNLIGIKNAVYLATDAHVSQNDFNIQVDLDGDGILDNRSNLNIIITTRYGAEINLTNQSGSGTIQLSIRTPDDERDTGKNITNIETIEAIINVTNGSENTTVNTKETIKIYLQNNTYYLEFGDRDGNKPNLPIAENGSNNTIFFGQINRPLINKETAIIKKDSYLILSDISKDRGSRSTYALQYKGADKITNDLPAMKFRNLGNGVIIEQVYSNNSPLATLKLGGQDFKVFKSPNADVSTNDFDIQVDLDASGSLSSDNGYVVPITTHPKGVEINITNETLLNTVQLTIRTFDIITNETVKAKDNVDTLYPTLLVFNISASDGNVRYTPCSWPSCQVRINYRNPDGVINKSYAYTSYGTFITIDESSKPPILDIDYPSIQREPLVYYENGGEHLATLSNLVQGQHIVKINCKDIFDGLTTYHITFNVSAPFNLVSYYPTADTVNISPDTNITFNFNRSMNLSTLTNDNIIIIDFRDNKVKGRIFYDNVTNQITFDPHLLLLPKTIYQVTILPSIKDSNGSHPNSKIQWLFTTITKDTDNDGIPDNEDNDIDNDGINDTMDFFRGNLSSINSNFFNLSMKIDSDNNISKIFNGTKKIEFFKGERRLLKFDYIFANDTKLDLSNISILNASNSSLGGVIIRGIGLYKFGFKKTTLVERVNDSMNGLCIKDEEIDWIDNISSSCDAPNEYKVECDGTSQNGYACIYNSTINSYEVTGLSNSGVVQLSYTKPSSSGSSGSSGGSSGGGSGGGGGGGGGAAGFVCNKDWKCGEWSECINGLQTRQCEFVKIPQQWQETSCPDETKKPVTSQICEVKTEIPKTQTKPIEVKEFKEETKPKETNQSKEQITGMAVQETKQKPNRLLLLIPVIGLLSIGIFVYFKFFRAKT